MSLGRMNNRNGVQSRNVANYERDLSMDPVPEDFAVANSSIANQFSTEMSQLDLSRVQHTQWKVLFHTLCDPRVSEIEINGPDNVQLRVNGEREPLGKTVGHPVAWTDVIEFGNTMADVEAHSSHYGKSYKDSYCLWEGGLRLHDKAGRLIVKARFHCVKPPVCEFPLVTIAKQSTTLTTLEAIQRSGSMTMDMMMFIQVLVKTKQTIVFSGGTGAGKTTFMSACCKEMDPLERVGIYEDTPELYIQNDIPNSFNMMSFPAQPGVNPNDQADLDWCIRQGQRQRVDRLLVGECRGPEFASFLTAANSGFDGSMTTMHANDPKQALDKMASFTKRAPGNASTPMSSINHDIAMSINYIIQLAGENQTGHGYRVTAIEEVSNTVGSDDAAKIKTQTIYSYDPVSDSWSNPIGPENDRMLQALNYIKTTHTLAGNPALEGKTQRPLTQQSFLNTTHAIPNARSVSNDSVRRFGRR